MEEKHLQRVMVAGKIRDYIDSHLGDNHLEDEFSLDKIARELNYSKFYMERVFSEVTGTTIFALIINSDIGSVSFLIRPCNCRVEQHC